MKTRMTKRRTRRRRRGAEVLELSIVLALFLLLNWGIFEFGRVMMMQEIITNGAREGARRGVVVGATNAQALAAIDTYLNASRVTGFSRTITPSIDVTDRGETFTVQVTLPFDAVDWGYSWLDQKNLVAVVEMRKE